MELTLPVRFNLALLRHDANSFQKRRGIARSQQQRLLSIVGQIYRSQLARRDGIAKKNPPFAGEGKSNIFTSCLNVNIAELKRQDLCKLFRAFLAPVVLCDILLCIKVRKLKMPLFSHKHRTDDHFLPEHSLAPALAAK